MDAEAAEGVVRFSEYDNSLPAFAAGMTDLP